MKNICVDFETWTISDGSYTPMKPGDIEVFSIGINTNKVRIPTRNKKYLKQKKHANYLFSGEVIYKTYTHNPVIVVDTGVFKFFVSGDIVSTFEVGQFIEGQGVLAVDSYEWMHMWNEDGAPHIYYDFTIEKIMGSKMAFEPYWKSLGEDEESMDILIRPNLDEDNLLEMKNVDIDDMILSHIEINMIKIDENPGGYTLHDGDKKFPFGYLSSDKEHKIEGN